MKRKNGHDLSNAWLCLMGAPMWLFRSDPSVNPKFTVL